MRNSFALLVLFVAQTSLGAIQGDLLWESQKPKTRLNWALKKIKSEQAWKISEGKKDIVIAVIDTGIDTEHPDLKENLWFNPGEIGRDKNGNDKSSNGIDDDKNGFVDDIHGWNFVRNNNDVKDYHGHGTHVSGIIAGRGIKNPAFRGVAPNVKIMTLKYYDKKGAKDKSVEYTIRAIQYAIQMKVQIINYSGGGTSQSFSEKIAIQQAAKAGILFVAAAGNKGVNSDLMGFYPAGYALDNIISVGAMNEQNQILKSSNFGASAVDIAAPGEHILSTLPGGKYGFMTGTSQATAYVTGVAALILSVKPNAKRPDQLIRHILATGDKELSLIGKTKSYSRLNSHRALAMELKN